MEKIRAVIRQHGTLSSNLDESQHISGEIGKNKATQYYYTKSEIDAFREEDREYVNAQDLLLQENIDASGHKLFSSLDNNNILTISLLDANDNVIATTSEQLNDNDRYVVRGEYDSQTQSIIVYYNDGTSFSISIAGLIDDLPSKQDLANETLARQNADNALSTRIDNLESEGFVTQDINTSSISVQYTKSKSKITLESTSNWENYLIDINDEIASVVYGNGYFIACSYSGKIIYSQDGEVWSLFPQIFSQQGLDKIVYGSGYFLAICYYTKTIYKAYNPNVWELYCTLEDITPINLQYVNNRFIVCGNDGKIAYNNGKKFEVIEVILNEHLNSIAYGNTVYVGVGTSGLLMYSKDCKTWYNRTDNEFNEDYKNVIYNDGLFLANTNSKLRYSLNYYEFENCTIPDIGEYSIKDICYGEMSYRAILNTNSTTEILKSSKGIEFEEEDAFNTKNNTICYGKSEFIVLGTNEMVYVLDLSINWNYSKPTLESDEYLWMRDVNYQNNGDVLYSQPYFMGYVDKDIDNLENYYDKPTTNNLLDEKQDDMIEVTDTYIDNLFD